MNVSTDGQTDGHMDGGRFNISRPRREIKICILGYSGGGGAWVAHK